MCILASLMESMCKSCSLDAIMPMLTNSSWNPEGVLLGKIAVANGGVNNFAFVPGGMYIFNAYKLFKITIQAEGRTVRRDFGLT